jgi:hypothetical protein
MATRPLRKAPRADELAAQDDYNGAAVWRRITHAVGQRSRTARQPGSSTDRRNPVAPRSPRRREFFPRPRHVSPFLNSIAWPEFHIERGLASNRAPLTAQMPFKRRQARVTGPTLQYAAFGMIALWPQAWQFARTRWKTRKSSRRKA